MINIAILGAGSMGRTHTEAYLNFPDECRITAVINPHREKAEALVKEFHLDGAKVYAFLRNRLLIIILISCRSARLLHCISRKQWML